MRKVIAVLGLTIAGLIPLLRYHPSTVAAQHNNVAATAPTTTAPTTDPAAPSGTPGPSGTPTAGAAATVDGSTVDTEFGPYQVRVTFSGTKIADVQIITEPGDRHSQRIASAAAPILKQEALQAQSAKVDTVSGATVTTEAYAQSLQAAIDAHH